MKFKVWLTEQDEGTNKVLAHISGASGSGKTTLAKKLKAVYPEITFKDLDYFDDQAVNILGWKEVKKNSYTDKMLAALADKRQDLMDDFIRNSKKEIVFVGHHTEGDHVLKIPTKNRFLLDVDARTSAIRAYKRSQKESPKERRTLEELPEDQKEAQETIDWLKKNNYKPMSAQEITTWIGKQ